MLRKVYRDQEEESAFDELVTKTFSGESAKGAGQSFRAVNLPYSAENRIVSNGKFCLQSLLFSIQELRQRSGRRRMVVFGK
ncbi:hypothetical protein DQG23_27820 [Paenibacillus contaminans]|uniref:Uncharacterized protein n=1 Tax=Paenibacillus contaminans TaxID=450362 RepID=A0A329M9W2_9BACL|nr:hypothetical protein DQG23_27820 [Paenibacillus contaminans]